MTTKFVNDYELSWKETFVCWCIRNIKRSILDICSFSVLSYKPLIHDSVIHNLINNSHFFWFQVISPRFLYKLFLISCHRHWNKLHEHRCYFKILRRLITVFILLQIETFPVINKNDFRPFSYVCMNYYGTKIYWCILKINWLRKKPFREYDDVNKYANSKCAWQLNLFIDILIAMIIIQNVYAQLFKQQLKIW